MGVGVIMWLLIGASTLYHSFAIERIIEQNEMPTLTVDTSSSGRRIPDTLFGIFFEEVSQAGSGGLWAELVRNSGFEAGGRHSPSNINPWSIIGDDSAIFVTTELSSCFERNKVALRMEVLCNNCPSGGVGIYNPGFWGMNIEQGKSYEVIFYVRSTGSISIDVSLTSSDGEQVLATKNVIADATHVADWTRMEVMLETRSSNSSSRLQLTTTQKGTLWIDQVSAMPTDTYNGHGFRKDLFEKLAALKPRFLKFPGGRFVEGEWLKDAFHWKQTVGAWEDRPGHFGFWNYWTDDGLGIFEFLQLAEDLGAAPVWVINNGISNQDQVETSVICPFVQDILDGIEFARGEASTQWGSLRASMGHPEPFNLKYIGIGNKGCWMPYYQGNYLKFFAAIKKVYPNIQVVSNCDGSCTPLDHPADMYDYHIHTSADEMFKQYHKFEKAQRSGPKAFVSEYAVIRKDAGSGNLLAALAEAAFLIGIEMNSDVVQMASYARLFVNTNNRTDENPAAIVFDSSRIYVTPSYWVQQFFTSSSGATLLSTSLQGHSSSASLVASAISWKNATDDKNYVTIKIVNFDYVFVNLKLSFEVNKNSLQLAGSKKTILTSNGDKDENSYENPMKVVPYTTEFHIYGNDTSILLWPFSFTAVDLVQE